MTTLTDEEIGKTVVGSNGEEIGIVSSIESETAYIEPEPGIVDRVKGVLGWESDTEDTVPISTEEISEVTEDEVRIEPDFGEPVTGEPTGEAALDEPSVASSSEHEPGEEGMGGHSEMGHETSDEGMGGNSEMEHTDETIGDEREESRGEEDDTL